MNGEGQEIAGKHPLRSCTLWAAVLVAAAPALPLSGPWIHVHQDDYNRMLGVLMIALRLKTNGPIRLGKEG